MTQTVLLTLGRLPKALDFARAFHAAGWRVLVAEPAQSHLTGISRCVTASFVVPPPTQGKQAYLSALAKIVDDEHVDLVLPLSEESMHVAGLVDFVAPQVRVYAPPQAALLALHDKARFIKLADSYGLAVPSTALLGTREAAALAEQSDYVLKPVYSCSGRGVSLRKAGTTLPAPSTDKNQHMIVQQQLTGEQISTFGIAHKGRLIVNVAYQGTIMSGSVAVAFERVVRPEIDQWVTRFVAAAEHSGFISFDFFVDEHGVARAIECNPRVTSGVHFIASGLVEAVLTPETAAPTLMPFHPRMQFFATLTEVQSTMFQAGFWAKLKAMFAARDVCWRIDDPLPLLTMPVTSFPMIWNSIRTRKSFGEVFTQDIVWFHGQVLEEPDKR